MFAKETSERNLTGWALQRMKSCAMNKTATHLPVFLALFCAELSAGQHKAQPSETPRFFYKGTLMSDTTIPGQQKRDNAQPANAVCWQLSRDRFIWTFSIMTYQGTDSTRAIAYQIRRDAPEGRVLNEGLFAAATDQWEAFGDGETYFRQQGHGKVFGAPKGAIDRHGKLLPSQNVFFASWYEIPRAVDRASDLILSGRVKPRGSKIGAAERLVSVQFRLNDAEDDIELLTRARRLTQKGFESGGVFCSLGTAVTGVNHWYTPEVPFNEDYTRWVDVLHFSTTGVAPVMLEFNRETGLYEWVRTGRLTLHPQGYLIECSLTRLGSEWIAAVRSSVKVGTQTVWFKTHDLFGRGLGEPVLMRSPDELQANRSAYVCGDGVLRIFGGRNAISPFGSARNPVYCWDVDPDTYALANCRTVLSSDDIGLTEGLPGSNLVSADPALAAAVALPEKNVKLRMFLSAPFKNRQIATTMVKRVIAGPPAEEEMSKYGVHYWYVTYDRDIEDAWRFAARKPRAAQPPIDY